MAILVRNIKTGLENSEQTAFEKAIETAKINKSAIANIYVAKSSVDARHKNSIQFVYTIGIELKEGEEAAVNKAASNDVVLNKIEDLKIETGSNKLDSRPVIAGFGPAGMFAGLILARCGYRPIILERGGQIEDRTAAVDSFWKTGSLNENSNVQFGEGGAGTFSDGKLTTRINDPICSYVLKEFVHFGAPKEVLQKSKPHIGTDYLRNIVRNIREEIKSLGGEVRFNSKLEDIIIKNGRLEAIKLNGENVPAQSLILAIGHSARDTFEMLCNKGLCMEQKAFSVGVRIEHLQSEVDKALYGQAAGHPSLPKGEYQLSHRENDRAVYTFCMCPGGFVVPSASEKGCLVTNGMSYYDRNGENANSALAVSVDGRDFGTGALAGVEFQRKLEQAAFEAGGSNWSAPMQTVGRFMNGLSGADLGRVKPTFANGTQASSLTNIFPSHIADMLKTGITVFNRKQPGFGAADAILTGVETRTSSPVRILRGENLQTLGIDGIFPCGEGAGYAGGIISAAVDGIKSALKFASQYSPN